MLLFYTTAADSLPSDSVRGLEIGKCQLVGSRKLCRRRLSFSPAYYPDYYVALFISLDAFETSLWLHGQRCLWWCRTVFEIEFFVTTTTTTTFLSHTALFGCWLKNIDCFVSLLFLSNALHTELLYTIFYQHHNMFFCFLRVERCSWGLIIATLVFLR